MRNSCTSAPPSTRAWEQQELNNTKEKKTKVIREAGTKK